MFQRQQIGKKRSKSTQAQAMLNRICFTPNGDQYSLVSHQKVGNRFIWVYEWLNCPEGIKAIVSHRLASTSALGVEQIVEWIKELRSIKG